VARWVALLRGVNVAGRNRLPMADLRAALTAVGYRDVATHLQSGNALLTADEDDADAIAHGVVAAIDAHCGLTLSVVVRASAELAAVVAGDPLPGPQTSHLHVAFLSEAPAPERLAALDPAAFAPDTFRVVGREAYVWYPNGMGRSKLTNDVWERRLGVISTTRNWSTVTRLVSLASGSLG
jgi:uncharacterized protein (DUF1697 family)